MKMEIRHTRICGRAMVRGKFIAISTYIKKTDISQINNLIIHLDP
jgi:hypothetical protein